MLYFDGIDGLETYEYVCEYAAINSTVRFMSIHI